MPGTMLRYSHIPQSEARGIIGGFTNILKSILTYVTHNQNFVTFKGFH